MTQVRKGSPADVAAEQAVLGGMLVDNSSIPEAIRILDPEDFYSEDHQKLFRVILALFEAGTSVDHLTVSDRLESQGVSELSGTGQRVYLCNLTETVATGAIVADHSQIVKGKSKLRSILTLASEMQSRAMALEDPEEIIMSTDERLLDLHQLRDEGGQFIGDLVPEATESMDDYCERQSGTITGFPDLDNKLSPMRGGDMILLAARPSVGKTALALTIAEHVAGKGKTVAFASLEMSKLGLTERLICSKAQVSGHRLRSGKLHDDEWLRIGHATLEYAREEPRLVIFDRNLSTTTKLRAEMKKLQARHGLDLVVVDYLQLMSARGENRNQEISKISSGLKEMAKDLNVPVIVLSQLSRALESRSVGDKRPRLHDLRESGSLEQDADTVLFIYRPSMHGEEPPKGLVCSEDQRHRYAEFIIAKQRQGPRGAIVPVWFYEKFTEFRSLARARYESPAEPEAEQIPL